MFFSRIVVIPLHKLRSSRYIFFRVEASSPHVQQTSKGYGLCVVTGTFSLLWLGCVIVYVHEIFFHIRDI